MDESIEDNGAEVEWLKTLHDRAGLGLFWIMFIFELSALI